MSLSEDLVRKISKTGGEYRRRVRLEAGIYVLLNVTAIISIIIIIWQYRLFITIAQRSNVETLTLGLVVVLFSYLVLTTFRGFIGALRMLYYNLPRGGTGNDTPEAGASETGATGSAAAGAPPMSERTRRIETRKHQALEAAEDDDDKTAYFDYAFHLENTPDEPIAIVLEDAVGKLGTLVIDGVQATFQADKKHMSNTLFEYLLNQIEHCVRQRERKFKLTIVAWSSIDDDEAAMYSSQVRAFRNLAQQLEKGPIWPTQTLNAEDVAYISGRLREIVPALRDESFLPDTEYEAEYSIPIIPEPLGFISLKRNEQRADPVATMGCAALVTLGIMLLLILFTVLPPWLPSR